HPARGGARPARAPGRQPVGGVGRRGGVMRRRFEGRGAGGGIAAAALFALLAGCAGGERGAGAAADGAPASAEGYPARRLDWTIAFGPGGGNDRLSRTLIEI